MVYISISSIVFAFSCFWLHIEGVADTRQRTLQHRQEKTVCPLFVRGGPFLKTLDDSGPAPKCNMPVLRTHLRSRRTTFPESQKKTKRCPCTAVPHFVDLVMAIADPHGQRGGVFCSHGQGVANRAGAAPQTCAPLSWRGSVRSACAAQRLGNRWPPGGSETRTGDSGRWSGLRRCEVL